MKRKTTAIRDPIVDDIREIKRRLAERFKYDPRAKLEDAQGRQKHAGRKLVSLMPENCRVSKLPR